MKLVEENIYNLGASCPTQKVFEGEIPLSKGMSYNSYLIKDEKTCLLDSADANVIDTFFDNLKEALGDRELDYFVIHHLEPDHTAGITKILKLYPNVKIFISALGLSFLRQFFRDCKVTNFQIIKDGDQLNLGEHNLTFIAAPLVHWPEVMMSYESKTKILFSADAFGSFTCFDKLDSSEYEDQDELLYEERRYYTNIVGKYGDKVQNVLKKASNLDIKKICSLHGPIHTKRIPLLLKYYDLWSKYEKEKEGVLIVYTTIYGHSAKAAEYFENQFKHMCIDYDTVCLNDTDFSVSLAKTFIYDKIILIAPTFNMGLFPKMREYLEVVADHDIRNKTFALIENCSWAPQAKNCMTKLIEPLKNCTIVPTTVTIKSSLADSDYPMLDQIIQELDVKASECKLDSKHTYRCKNCGYIHGAEELEEDYVCPMCGEPASNFEKIK